MYNKRQQRHTTRWLAIALTPNEIIKLKEEPHLTGIIIARLSLSLLLL